MTVADLRTGADVAGARQALADVAAELDASGDPQGRMIAVLREHRLLSYLVPAELGGDGGDAAGLVEIAHELGAVCPAAAVAWVMHCQQVAVIDEYAAEPVRSRVLRAVAGDQGFLASVTTEPRKGGHMLTAVAAMDSVGGEVSFERQAPVVTGGRHAQGFLVTVRRSADAPPGDVVLVYCDREQAGVRVTGALDMLGMRAAGNVSLVLEATVPAGQVLQSEIGFARIAMRTMAPLGHLGWAASWVGAARELLRHTVARTRRASGDGPAVARTEATYQALARIRCHLDTADAILAAALREFRARQGAERERPEFQILINNTKVVAAEQTYAAVDKLLELTGMGVGYQRDSALPIERYFRDLRSASLMYSNERLLQSSGRLALMDLAMPLLAGRPDRHREGERP